MKSFLIKFLTLIIILFASNGYSQDTLNLLDGQRIAAIKIYNDTSNALLNYDIIRNQPYGFQITWNNCQIEYYILTKKVIKQKYIDKLEIYSIDYADKTHLMIYQQDSAIGYPLNVKNMENYMMGEREARKNYKAPWVTLGGVLIGGIAADYIGFWSLTTMVVYGTGMALFDPKLKTSENTSPDLKTDRYFIKGYKDHATRKKVKNALLGTAVGIAALAITSIIINAQ
jgi:hypothetical protein